MRLHWANLSTEERGEYMRLQMAHGGGRSAYIPDDCSTCNACDQPMLGSPGLCYSCYPRWKELRDKLKVQP